MDFFDKLGGFAKNAGGKTSDFLKTATDRADDMIEIGKLKTKINAAKKSAEDAKLRLGEYCYQKYRDNSDLDDNERELYSAISKAEDEAAALFAEIEKIKSENQEQPQKEAETVADAPKFCSFCGAPLAAGLNFCGSCGAKVEK